MCVCVCVCRGMFFDQNYRPALIGSVSSLQAKESVTCIPLSVNKIKTRPQIKKSRQMRAVRLHLAAE